MRTDRTFSHLLTQTLRSRNESWGYRDVEAVVAEAKKAGLRHVEQNEMPANNLMLVFEKD